MPNRLIHETSPYLLQHAHNPVDWYAWGPEALQKAKLENKPIFLSIGYAACHWCHVMEHESFEDEQTAGILNEHFVSIKVDREERPDLDSIYMNAVVAMTGQGGWPMSVFLTPEGEPFYGGTYFPSTPRYNMPSFREVLHAIAQSWNQEVTEIRRVSNEVSRHLRDTSSWNSTEEADLSPEMLQQVTQSLLKGYDWQQGGWGRAPRFPPAIANEYLLMQSARGDEKALQAADHVLRMMSRGGMYDVVGGGFHRYSTDDAWLVPHFEKMLYDNAQLALAYLHAYLLTGRLVFRQVCTETLDFIRREMTHASGGFYSSLDADSEGKEGKYYVWEMDEIEQALTDKADRELFYQVYAVSQYGNFEGKNILQRKEALDSLAAKLDLDEQTLIERLSAIHARLYQAREQRVRPLTDDKVLVSWNALALRAFAQAARYLKRPDYLDVARKNARFLLDEMHVEGRLLRTWRNGQSRHNAYLEDYAGLTLALLDVYQSDPDPRWYAAARRMVGEIRVHFHDPRGGFFDTRSDHDTLLTRPKETQDNAVPAGTALAAHALLLMAAFDEQEEWRHQAEIMIAAVQNLMARYPTAFGQWLQALDLAVGPVQQIAVVGETTDARTQALLEEVWRVYRPRAVVAVAESNETNIAPPGLLRERPLVSGLPTAYVCQSFNCKLPVTDAPGLRSQLEATSP